jgi:hypothetical protein
VDVSIVNHHQRWVVKTLLIGNHLLESIKVGICSPNPDQTKTGVSHQLPCQSRLPRAGCAQHQAVPTSSREWILNYLAV